jgi:hypothetical protein
MTQHVSTDNRAGDAADRDRHRPGHHTHQEPAMADTTTGHGHDSDPIAHALDTAIRVLHAHRRNVGGQCTAGCPTWPCAPELTAEHNVEVLAS